MPLEVITPDEATPDSGLRHGILSPLETLSQSISAIAPTTSPALTVPLIFALSGNGTWLAYLLAMLAMLLIALCIARFCSHLRPRPVPSTSTPRTRSHPLPAAQRVERFSSPTSPPDPPSSADSSTTPASSSPLPNTFPARCSRSSSPPPPRRSPTATSRPPPASCSGSKPSPSR